MCRMCVVNFFGCLVGDFLCLPLPSKSIGVVTNIFLGQLLNVERKLIFIVFVVQLKQRSKRWKCCSCGCPRWYCTLTRSFNVSV